LIQSALEADGIACETICVRTGDGLVTALDRSGIDLIPSDLSLPVFDGLPAVKILRGKWPATPMVMVSTALGQKRAVDLHKGSATDPGLRGQLSLLAPAMRRALDQAGQRAANRRMEEALRETLQQLRIIFSKSPLGIALVAADGRAVLTNAALQKMLGYTRDELNGLPFEALMHPDDRAKGVERYKELIQGARASYQMEKRYLRKDGEVVWTRVSVSEVPKRGGNAGFAIKMIEDITEHRRLQAQFIEAQKMEVVGQLACGVAHDFNNILAVIIGYSDLTIQKLGLKRLLKSHLVRIRSAADRAVGLTRQLLIFGSKQAVQPVVLDLNEVVKEMDKMLRRLIDENIEMTIVPGENLGRVKADSGYVGQVLMNLVVNARDAMPNGGKLIIATDNVTLDKDFARARSGAIPGEYVMFSVSDTGTGMTDEVKARMFDAFFTTKPKGKGTGLGLATCQTIVQQSAGYIEVESEIGKGTTFRIYFPRVRQALDIRTQLVLKGPLPRGAETLLVVEDDPSLRQLARSVLEGRGYTVLSASNGQDALHAARDHKGPPIQLVITDVIMPLMGGKVMAEWLKTVTPSLKVLFTSGYTDDAVTQTGTLQPGVEFLPKPYTPATLARKVRKMLDTN